MAWVTAPGAAAAQDHAVTWLIFVDDLHLDFRDTGDIRKLVGSIASQLIRNEDALVLRSSGPSFDGIAVTVKRSLLDTAIARIAGNALPPAATLRSSAGTDEVQHRISLALSAAVEMLNAAPSFPGRRVAMLYVSNGYALPQRDARLEAFADAARQHQIRVFAMNALSLPGTPARPAHQDDAARAAMLTSLREMSEPTGGLAVLNESEFVDAFERGTIDRWVR